MQNGIASLVSLFEEKLIVDVKQMRGEGINFLVYHKNLAESLNFFFQFITELKARKTLHCCLHRLHSGKNVSNCRRNENGTINETQKLNTG